MTHLREGARQASRGEVKGFPLWVDMVELKRADVPVVPAERAASPCFVDELLFHSPAARRNGFGPTLRTPELAVVLDANECERSMAPTVARPRFTCRARTTGPMVESRQAVTAQPVPDGRVAAIEVLRDLTHGQPRVDEVLERFPSYRSSRRSLLLAARLQPVLGDPVGDRRLVSPHTSSDVREREAVRKKRLELRLLHM